MPEPEYLYKQSSSKPLFEDLLWSKPENKHAAGKLLIIGGNAHEFAAPGEAYQEAVLAGIGTAKVLLPTVLQKTLGHVLENGEFAASNKSGSFARTALNEWLQWGNWADAVLIAGDLGRNSETAVVLESFVEKFSAQLVITKDALDYFTHQPLKLLERDHTTLVASFAQLQKMCSNARWPEALRFSMTLNQLVEALHELSEHYAASVVVEHNGVLFTANSGQVCITKIKDSETWRVKMATHGSVWQLQNPGKPFEALGLASLALAAE